MGRGAHLSRPGPAVVGGAWAHRGALPAAAGGGGALQAGRGTGLGAGPGGAWGRSSGRAMAAPAAGEGAGEAGEGHSPPEFWADAITAVSSGVQVVRTPLSGGVAHAGGLASPVQAVRNILERARYLQLCTIMSRMHHRRAGYPVTSLTDFVVDEQGRPIFPLSDMGTSARNIRECVRCSVHVQLSDFTESQNVLANARVTLFGDVEVIPEGPELIAAVEEFKKKHGKETKYNRLKASNYSLEAAGGRFYRMSNIVDCYFVGGFGTLAWIDVQEYLVTRPDSIVSHPGHDRMIDDLNAEFSELLRGITSPKADAARVIAVDRLGADVHICKGDEWTVKRVKMDMLLAQGVAEPSQVSKTFRAIFDGTAAKVYAARKEAERAAQEEERRRKDEAAQVERELRGSTTRANAVDKTNFPSA